MGSRTLLRRRRTIRVAPPEGYRWSSETHSFDSVRLVPASTSGVSDASSLCRCDGLVAFHHAVDQQKISLLDPFPKMPIQEDVYFPGKEDHHKYGSTGRQMLHEWLELLDDQSRKEALEANVDRLQLLSRQFRLTYLQL